MKLMIIDDEKIIREGIHYSISWGKIGIDIVKDYSGGEEALKDFPEFLPDIVISDVKMEEMNGLEFFSEAKKIKNNLKIIFISGYADFEYVVQAMRMGAVDYELKPVNNEKLKNLVLKVIDQILDESRQQVLINEIEQSTRAKKTFEMLNSSAKKKDLIYYFQNMYNIDRKQRIIISLLEIDNYDSLDNNITKQLENIKNELKEKVNLILWEYSEGICIMAAAVNASYIFSINTQYLVKKSIEHANYYNDNCTTLSAAISNITTVKEIYNIFQRLKVVIEDKFYDGPGSIYLITEVAPVSCEVENSVNNLKNEFLLMFTDMNLIEINKILDKFENFWKFERRSSKAEIKNEISDFMKDIMLKQISENQENQAIIIDIIQFNEQISNLNFLQDVIKFWKNWIMEYYNKCAERNIKKYSKNIRKALIYISDNYRKPISVESVSQYIEKTPNYFSALFKKEIGMSFSEYINVLRIKRAKDLMENSDMLLSEISEYVGYTNYIYFTQVFKKIEGVSPSKKRNHYKKI